MLCLDGQQNTAMTKTQNVTYGGVQCRNRVHIGSRFGQGHKGEKKWLRCNVAQVQGEKSRIRIHTEMNSKKNENGDKQKEKNYIF
jgi:hypothetical protein